MWVLHTTNTKIVEPRLFRIYGTGAEIKDLENLIYIGTFQMHNGDMVWHVFEEIEDSSLFIEDVLKQSVKQPTEQ